MLKVCSGYISRHIQIMFRCCITDGVFPFERKGAKVVPAHKKVINNHNKTISLLPTSDKIFERLIYSEMCEFYENNFLIKSIRNRLRRLVY